MKSLILLVFTIALFNYGLCQDQYVQLNSREYSQEQTAIDAWNVGWQALLKDGIDNSVFPADTTWTDTNPSCVFKKSIEGGLTYYFLGHAKDQNGNVCNSLIFADYNSSGAVYTYYSYYYKDMFVNRYANDQLWVEVTTPETSSAPATATEDLAPQGQQMLSEEEDFVVPEVDEVEIETEGEAPVGENGESESEENPKAEVEVDVEIDANADPLAGYLLIDLSDFDNNAQGSSALNDGLTLVVQNAQTAGEIVSGDWNVDELVKAYLQVADDGIRFYFAVTIRHDVDNFSWFAAVEYYVFQDVNGVNQLETYRLGDQWAMGSATAEQP